MNPNDGRVISNIIVQALKGEDITIYGNGTQTRSFQYVDDLVEGIIRLMQTEETITGPINIGNTAEFTMIELAEKIINLTGSTSKMVFMPLPQDDPLHRQPDITLAHQLLDGWQPTVGLDSGLSKTIAYFRRVV
jgi:UDP-glucuronate decarboxylase